MERGWGTTFRSLEQAKEKQRRRRPRPEPTPASSARPTRPRRGCRTQRQKIIESVIGRPRISSRRGLSPGRLCSGTERRMGERDAESAGAKGQKKPRRSLRTAARRFLEDQVFASVSPRNAPRRNQRSHAGVSLSPQAGRCRAFHERAETNSSTPAGPQGQPHTPAPAHDCGQRDWKARPARQATPDVAQLSPTGSPRPPCSAGYESSGSVRLGSNTFHSCFRVERTRHRQARQLKQTLRWAQKSPRGVIEAAMARARDA